MAWVSSFLLNFLIPLLNRTLLCVKTFTYFAVWIWKGWNHLSYLYDRHSPLRPPRFAPGPMLLPLLLRTMLPLSRVVFSKPTASNRDLLHQSLKRYKCTQGGDPNTFRWTKKRGLHMEPILSILCCYVKSVLILNAQEQPLCSICCSVSLIFAFCVAKSFSLFIRKFVTLTWWGKKYMWATVAFFSAVLVSQHSWRNTSKDANHANTGLTVRARAEPLTSITGNRVLSSVHKETKQEERKEDLHNEQSIYKIWSFNMCLRTSFGTYNNGGFKGSWDYHHLTSKKPISEPLNYDSLLIPERNYS